MNVLAIDIGTSSIRAMIFDSRGTAIEGLKSQQHCRLVTDPPGTATIDADEMVAVTAACIDQVLNLAGPEAINIAAVGSCTFWHSMVGVDIQDHAITPIYTWADTRAGDAARKLELEVGIRKPEVRSSSAYPGADAGSADEDGSETGNRKSEIGNSYHSRTGCVLHPSFFPARLAWLAGEQPEKFGRVAKWISPGEYLYLKLFGKAQCSISMASGTGLFNQNRCNWDDETLAALAIDRSHLSAVSDEPLSGLVPEWAGRWPHLAKIPWTPAIGDGASSNLGSGCATDRRIAINLGTSGAIRVLWKSEQVKIPPELWCYRLDRERFVMGAAFSDGGNLYAWMKKTLSLEDDEAIEQELARRAPDTHGLTFLPFLAGERSIGWRPHAKATLNGLSLSTDPLDILQAGMEAVALRFAMAEQILRRQFPQAEEIIVSGGAFGESRVWARMVADAIGRPITLSKEAEASSRGAAVVALGMAGAISDVACVPVSLGETIEPEPTRHARLTAALERQQVLYKKMTMDEDKQSGQR